MKKLLLIPIFVLYCLTASAQDPVADQRLAKALDALEKSEAENVTLKADSKAKDDVIAAQQDEIFSRDVLILEKNALIFLKDGLIESANKTIQRLEERDAIRIAEITALRKIKCDKDVWFGGVYKKIRCK
jgi:hypothetical protein